MQALILDHAHVYAFPGNDLDYMPKQARYVEDLETALSDKYMYDAHVTQYSAPQIPLRLDTGMFMSQENMIPFVFGKMSTYVSKNNERGKGIPLKAPTLAWAAEEAPKRYAKSNRVIESGGIAMHCVFFDIDMPKDQHTGECLAPYRKILLEGVQRLFYVHPGFYYETRGGGRIVYELPAPLYLKTKQDAAKWTGRFKTWCNYLSRITGFPVMGEAGQKGIDPLADWQRLMRLPHATRPRQKGDLRPVKGPENRLILGNLDLWEPILHNCDRIPTEVVKDRAPSTTEGIFLEMFQAWGNLGEQNGSGGYNARCPLANQHSDHVDRPGIGSDFCVYGATETGGLGTLYCKHTTHTKLRGPIDWIRECGWTDEDFKLSPTWVRMHTADTNDSWGAYEDKKNDTSED